MDDDGKWRGGAGVGWYKGGRIWGIWMRDRAVGTRKNRASWKSYTLSCLPQHPAHRLAALLPELLHLLTHCDRSSPSNGSSPSNKPWDSQTFSPLHRHIDKPHTARSLTPGAAL